jgi:hypothetical protein
MRDFKVQAKAEIDEVQAHRGKIQQCLNVYAQASDCLGLIRDVSSPEKEFITIHDMPGTPTLDVLDENAESLASTSSKLRNEVADVGLRLNRPISHIHANEATRQERLSISCSSSQPHHSSTNVFRAISAADDSHQILVSTSGSPIHAQNISAGPRSSQWMGQMSEASLQLLSKDVRATHGTIHNSVDKSTRN